MDKQATIRWGKTEGAFFLSVRQLRCLSWLGNRAAFAVGMPTLSVLAFATSLYIPRLISPVEFGTYALLLSLCRYASRCDFGLSQLADQRLSAHSGDVAEVTQLLNARFRVGLWLLLLGAPAAGLIGPGFGAPWQDAMVAVAAGLCAMIAGGPATVFRAQGKTWEYTALAFLSGVGFIIPRLLGFAIGGVSGCFALWLLWNGTIAAFCLARNLRASAAYPSILKTLQKSFPLFVFASGWTLYVTADRWFVAALSSPRDLGLFALGANIVAAGIVTFGQISDVRYPHLLRRISLGKPFQYSRFVEMEFWTIGAFTAFAGACVIPCIPYVVARIFPAYAGAAQPMTALVASSVPMMSVAWFLPIAIARSRSPLGDAAIIFGPALATMAAGMVIGNHIAGVTGQAWACCLSSVVMLSGLAVVLHSCAVLHKASAVRAVLATSVMVGALTLLVMALSSSQVSAANATFRSMPPAGWKRTFFDQFDDLKIWDGTDGVWQVGYRNRARTNSTNKELEYYAAPSDRDIPTWLQPFKAGKNGLTITARATPSDNLNATGKLPYVSGLLNSSHYFSFTYGYAVLTVRVPQGRGLWPAFWLLPMNGRVQPELDIMEVIGHEPTVYYATLHSAVSGVSMHTISTQPLDETWHEFGVLWTPQTIVWFLDGSTVASTDTPADMHSPMYLLINLAVGGKWPGPPDANTSLLASMEIRSVSVYQSMADWHSQGNTRLERADQ